MDDDGKLLDTSVFELALVEEGAVPCVVTLEVTGDVKEEFAPDTEEVSMEEEVPVARRGAGMSKAPASSEGCA